MLIGYDASRAFVPEATGTENYSLNLLKALAKVDRKNQYRVYLRTGSSFIVNGSLGKISKKIPMNNERLTINFNWPANFEFRLIRPNRLWTQVGLALETWKHPVDLLFVPAHTLPILRKRKIGISNFKFQISNFPKYVVTIHDLGVEYLPGYHQFPQRYYLDLASKYASAHADAIIAVSQATKRDLVKRYGTRANKIFVVHEGVDTGFFRPRSKKEIKNVKLKFKIDGDYILFVGTIQPRKNLQMLIEAFGLLVGSNELVVGRKKALPTTNYKLQNMQLVIAGKPGWDYDEILASPKKFGLNAQVKFLGHVPDANLPALYSGAAVFAAPSLFEGFGLPILEALACGCPVVASDIGPHREIYKKLARGPVNSFPPAYAKASAGKPTSDEYAAVPLEAKRGGVGSSSRTAIPSISQLQTTNYELKTNFVPMTLVNPKNIDQWVQILYQYISQDKQNISIRQGLALPARLVAKRAGRQASEFSWEEAAKQTLSVFEALCKVK